MKKSTSSSIVIGCLIVLVAGVFFVMKKIGNLSSSDTDAPGQEVGEQVPVRIVPPNWDENDVDSDGITNADEEAQGLNPYAADTDGDTISDKREIDVFGTDPTKIDTDGDGYSDFVEIMNGYNPLGEGPLVQ